MTDEPRVAPGVLCWRVYRDSPYGSVYNVLSEPTPGQTCCMVSMDRTHRQIVRMVFDVPKEELVPVRVGDPVDVLDEMGWAESLARSIRAVPDPESVLRTDAAAILVELEQSPHGVERVPVWSLTPSCRWRARR